MQWLQDFFLLFLLTPILCLVPSSTCLNMFKLYDLIAALALLNLRQGLNDLLNNLPLSPPLPFNDLQKDLHGNFLQNQWLVFTSLNQIKIFWCSDKYHAAIFKCFNKPVKHPSIFFFHTCNTFNNPSVLCPASRSFSLCIFGSLPPTRTTCSTDFMQNHQPGTAFLLCWNPCFMSCTCDLWFYSLVVQKHTLP